MSLSLFCYENLAYLPVLKSGSTFILTTFLLNSKTLDNEIKNEIIEFVKNKNIDFVPHIFKDIYYDEILAVNSKKARDYFSFTFVRHPFDRFLSFYYGRVQNINKSFVKMGG